MLHQLLTNRIAHFIHLLITTLIVTLFGIIPLTITGQIAMMMVKQTTQYHQVVKVQLHLTL